MWTVGLSLTGNLLGMSEAEAQALPETERAARRREIGEQLHRAGAHYVVDSLADTPPVLEEIGARLARDERP